DDVRVRGGRAPGVVGPAADHAPRHAGGGDGARVEAAAAQVDLEEEGRGEVADLRAGDVDRMAVCRALAGEDERVAHALLPRLRGRAGALHPEPDAADVGDHVARVARVVAIVERGRRGDRRLRVLLFAQVVPDTAALGRTEGDL